MVLETICTQVNKIYLYKFYPKSLYRNYIVAVMLIDHREKNQVVR